MSEHCKIIFFDIDGTLLSTGGAGQVALGEALHDSFEVEFPFQGVQTSGRTDRGIVDEIFETHGVENTPDSREKFRESYLRRCLLYTSPSPRDRQKSRMPSSA